MKGYRSAIVTTLRPMGLWQEDWNPTIKALIANMKLERPPPIRTVPSWDLAVVLNYLMGPPFEPMEKASIKDLTLKTVFLVALASARRVSEIQALDFNSMRFLTQGDQHSVELAFCPGFLAKNQSRDKQAEPISFPALSNIIDKKEPDCVLCPVRALKWYRSRTLNSRTGRTQLFLQHRQDRAQAKVTAQSISRWISSVIKNSYAVLDSSEDLQKRANVRAHETRAWSTSWARANQVPTEQILRAATWRSNMTFCSHYLRDVSSCENGLYALGPIVAAQTVINR